MSYTPIPTGRTVAPQTTDRLLGGDGSVARTGDITIASILALAPAPVDQSARDAAAAAQTTANAAIPAAQKGVANGVATLGTDGKVPATQLATTGAAVPRVVTASGTVAIAAADGLVVINKATTGATAVTLEANPVAGAVHRIKDGRGDAGTNNITITPASGTIDGAASFVIATNRGAVTLEYSGTEWVVT